VLHASVTHTHIHEHTNTHTRTRAHTHTHPSARAEVRSAETVGPVLIHVITEKGHGYEPAEVSQDKMHGVAKFDPKTGVQQAVRAGVCVRWGGCWAWEGMELRCIANATLPPQTPPHCPHAARCPGPPAMPVPLCSHHLLASSHCLTHLPGPHPQPMPHCPHHLLVSSHCMTHLPGPHPQPTPHCSHHLPIPPHCLTHLPGPTNRPFRAGQGQQDHELHQLLRGFAHGRGARRLAHHCHPRSHGRGDGPHQVRAAVAVTHVRVCVRLLPPRLGHQLRMQLPLPRGWS